MIGCDLDLYKHLFRAQSTLRLSTVLSRASNIDSICTVQLGLLLFLSHFRHTKANIRHLRITLSSQNLLLERVLFELYDQVALRLLKDNQP